MPFALDSELLLADNLLISRMMCTVRYLPEFELGRVMRRAQLSQAELGIVFSEIFCSVVGAVSLSI